MSALPRDGGRLAIDVGGTSIRAIGLDPAGRIVERVDVPTPVGGPEVLAGLAGVVDGLVATFASRGLPVADIGLACPGLVDGERGVVTLASNLGWHDLPLGAWLTDRYGAVARIDNDARVGALAEHALLSPTEGSRLAFVPIGTGVSAAYFSEGRLARGASGAAGELGHVRAVPEGELCSCGNRGCVEAYASAANIRSRYERLSGRTADTRTIAASVGIDPVASRVWTEAMAALASGLAALVTLVDPSLIVVGGGLSRAGDAVISPLIERMRGELAWRPLPTVRASTLAPDSTLVGAALLGTSLSPEARATLVGDLVEQLRERERVA